MAAHPAPIEGRDAYAAVFIVPAACTGIAIETAQPGMTDHALAYLLRRLADELDAPAAAFKAAS